MTPRDSSWRTSIAGTPLKYSSAPSDLNPKNPGTRYISVLLPLIDFPPVNSRHRDRHRLILRQSEQGDILLVESVDRLSRLSQDDFSTLKQRIKAKGLRLVVADLPTTHTVNEGMTGDILNVINSMLIDLLATMAKLDNDKRRERIKQGLERSGYKSVGKKANTVKHERIKQLLEAGNMTKDEIAKAVGVGVATVYRIIKENNQS